MAQDGSSLAHTTQHTRAWTSPAVASRIGIDSAAPADDSLFPQDAIAPAASPPVHGFDRARARFLLAIGLLGAACVVALALWLAQTPQLNAVWRLDLRGRVELISSDEPVLRDHVGQYLVSLSGADGTTVSAQALTLQRSPRWVPQTDELAHEQALRARLSELLGQERVRLTFTDATPVELRPSARGVTGLPLLFWLLSGFALGLVVVPLDMVRARASAPNLAYAAMALCQAGSMVFIAAESTLDRGVPWLLAQCDLPLRMAFALFTAAAVVQAVCLHPRRLPAARWIAASAWCVTGLCVMAYNLGWTAQPWWHTQLLVVVLGLAVLALLTWSYRIEPHPVAVVLRRFGMLTLGTWILLSVAMWASDRQPHSAQNIADIGSVLWYVFLASTLMLVPFMAKSRSFLREFALLAALSTVTTSLDLLFTAWFSFSGFAALTLAMVVSLAVYSAVRPWILNQLQGGSRVTTERMFEHLYRIAREVEIRPDRTPALLAQLLGELFEPGQVQAAPSQSSRSRVAGAGSGLMVPVPELGDAQAASEARARTVRADRTAIRTGNLITNSFIVAGLQFRLCL